MMARLAVLLYTHPAYQVKYLPQSFAARVAKGNQWSFGIQVLSLSIFDSGFQQTIYALKGKYFKARK